MSRRCHRPFCNDDKDPDEKKTVLSLNGIEVSLYDSFISLLNVSRSSALQFDTFTFCITSVHVRQSHVPLFDVSEEHYKQLSDVVRSRDQRGDLTSSQVSYRLPLLRVRAGYAVSFKTTRYRSSYRFFLDPAKSVLFFFPYSSREGFCVIRGL